MTAALVVFVVADALAGFGCIRARRYAHAIGLGGIAIPISMTVAAFVFANLGDPDLTLSSTERSKALLVGFGALALALVCLLWMTVAAVRGRPSRITGGRDG